MANSKVIHPAVLFTCNIMQYSNVMEIKLNCFADVEVYVSTGSNKSKPARVHTTYTLV